MRILLIGGRGEVVARGSCTDLDLVLARERELLIVFLRFPSMEDNGRIKHLGWQRNPFSDNASDRGVGIVISLVPRRKFRTITMPVVAGCCEKKCKSIKSCYK
ncbi:hypothetical protein NDU88_010801 [Pleurodeles waltl]|uniref:Uncharacterized protein n=1 Tax=Pleurodeles waltl TaxID=8319 RepID=A0AAV7S293_PLEWA|nr:hypothetical protein NDU88_010801 [Pleurodeles waltl]